MPILDQLLISFKSFFINNSALSELILIFLTTILAQINLIIYLKHLLAPNFAIKIL
jgi:hypothetical protein